jgi:hypothetical protein
MLHTHLLEREHLLKPAGTQLTLQGPHTPRLWAVTLLLAPAGLLPLTAGLGAGLLGLVVGLVLGFCAAASLAGLRAAAASRSAPVGACMTGEQGRQSVGHRAHSSPHIMRQCNSTSILLDMLQCTTMPQDMQQAGAAPLHQAGSAGNRQLTVLSIQHVPGESSLLVWLTAGICAQAGKCQVSNGYSKGTHHAPLPRPQTGGVQPRSS